MGLENVSRLLFPLNIIEDFIYQILQIGFHIQLKDAGY